MKKIKPGPGQESVWDYPRPPKVEPFKGHIRIVFEGQVICDTNEAVRLLETSHPPTYYLPKESFKDGFLEPNKHLTFCEYKGQAHYFDLVGRKTRSQNAAWFYPKVSKGYELLENKIAIYAHTVNECYVNNEKVNAQEGSFYGGWITSNIVGPFKGAPGTWGW
ncbi:MAG: DUF427 domain-containing protein [Bacteroidota bacterium]